MYFSLKRQNRALSSQGQPGVHPQRRGLAFQCQVPITGAFRVNLHRPTQTQTTAAQPQPHGSMDVKPQS